LQCKDWFRKTIWREGKQVSIEESWRKRRPLVFPQSDMKVQDKTGKELTVSILHMLFSANEVADLICSEDEGVVTIKSMRNWLPTAAYACEAANHLNELFSVSE
jgi:hypothetical protein